MMDMSDSQLVIIGIKCVQKNCKTLAQCHYQKTKQISANDPQKLTLQILIS